MNTSITISLIVYCWLCGALTVKQWNDFGNKPRLLIFMRVVYFVGSPLIAFGAFLVGLLWYGIVKPLNNQFQIIFWFRFYCTKQYRNMHELELNRLNSRALNWSTKSIHHRIMRFGVSKINKRHNYTPTTQP